MDSAWPGVVVEENKPQPCRFPLRRVLGMTRIVTITAEAPLNTATSARTRR